MANNCNVYLMALPRKLIFLSAAKQLDWTYMKSVMQYWKASNQNVYISKGSVVNLAMYQKTHSMFEN